MSMVTGVSSGGHPKGREDITVGFTEVPVKVYRTDGFPTIFAGFQSEWIAGTGDEVDFTFSAGAGMGSKYATLTVAVEGHETVYEYIDITELVEQRVDAIIRELRDREKADELTHEAEDLGLYEEE